MQSKAKQSRAEQSRAEQSRAERSRASIMWRLDETHRGLTWRAHSMVRKVWAITKLKIKLLKEATARPAERVSRGWISEGYSQARGPYDQAYALHTYMIVHCEPAAA